MPRNDGRGPTKPFAATAALNPHMVGNALFDRAVFAIGLDGSLVRSDLTTLLGVLGTKPEDLTPDELGALMPQIEKRLRLLVSPERAAESMRKLRALLLNWDRD